MRVHDDALAAPPRAPGIRRLRLRRTLLTAVAALMACQPPAPSVAADVLDQPTRDAIADTVRAESRRMLDVMRTRNADSVLAFYGARTAYVGNGVVGDWNAIVAGTPARYGTYTKVDCTWQTPFRVDVLHRRAAVVTAVLDCQKADSTGKAWHEVVARTEVLSADDGRWRIVAVHESGAPGSSDLK